MLEAESPKLPFLRLFLRWGCFHSVLCPFGSWVRLLEHCHIVCFVHLSLFPDYAFWDNQSYMTLCVFLLLSQYMFSPKPHIIFTPCNIGGDGVGCVCLCACVAPFGTATVRESWQKTRPVTIWILFLKSSVAVPDTEFWSWIQLGCDHFF